MQMFVLDFPLSRPIYFLAFRFVSRLFPTFFLTFSLGFFLPWSHLLQTHSCVFEKCWNMTGLILGFATLLFVAQCCAVLQGNAAWARRCYWELLLFVSHNKLGVLLLWKDDSFRCLSSCFMPPKFHIFSGDHALRFLLPPPPSGPTSACSSRFVSYKPIYFQRAIKNFSFDQKMFISVKEIKRRK